MQIKIQGRNTTVTNAMREYVEQKISKLDRVTGQLTHIDVTLSNVANLFVAEANLRVSGKSIHCSATHEDLYQAVDLLEEKALRVARKRKQRLEDRVRRAANQKGRAQPATQAA